MEPANLYDLCCYFEIALGAVVFVTLFFITAPYGRYSTSTWGLLIPARLGWFAMEFPAAVIHFYFFVTNKATASWATFAFCCLFELHYLQRSIFYPLIMPSSAKKMPISVPLLAITFNTLNGFNNGFGLYQVLAERYQSSTYFTSPNFIVGTVIFFVGMFINIQSDQILRNLRRQGENDYKVPYGGLHNYVASPNYFGEIVEWIGWGILTNSLCGFAFAIFSFANLAPRAISHRRWYSEKFKEAYPASRKAVIPFIL
jgi:protein-S-isoprenylcysteine O-methyltransferase Ste14